MSLLISTVSSGSTNRLAPLAEPPCTMPGIACAMLGAHHQHVAAVAVGDDLVLQVLRRVAPAQNASSVVRSFVRCLRSRSRIAGQRRAGVVGDVAARLDLAAHVGNLVRNEATPPTSALEHRKRGAEPPDRRCASARSTPGNRTGRAAAAARARDRRRSAPSRMPSRSAGARSGNPGWSARKRVPSVVARCAAMTSAGVGRADAARASSSRPSGVTARPATTATMRSNSRARSAPGFITARLLEGRSVYRIAGDGAGVSRTTLGSDDAFCPKDPSQMVDGAGDAGRAEAVVDVHDGDAVGATVEHAEQCGDRRRSWRRSRCWSARR